jgi:hypothetical protein
MHKNATKCNETLSKWCKNKHGALKIMDTLETYHALFDLFHGIAASAWWTDSPSCYRPGCEAAAL